MSIPASDTSPQPEGIEQAVPTLSVTVLNYNYAHYLPRCLDSILSQTRTDFELILINDCSTDDSLAVIEPYLADPRVCLVNHAQNKGYIASLLEGSELSRGRYITVISADDFCVSDRAFEQLLTSLEADEEVVFAYSAHGGYDDQGRRIWESQPYRESFVRSGVEEYRNLVLKNYILHSGVIIRASAYKALGGYEATVRYAPDTIMWLMLCTRGKVAYCADELYAYRRHGSNMSISLSGLKGGLEESLYGIRKSYDILDGSPGISKELYICALKRNLSGFAEVTMFAGHVRAGWYAFWCAVRLHPILTVCQTRTVLMIARTLLGPRGYVGVRALLHRNHRTLVPA